MTIVEIMVHFAPGLASMEAVAPAIPDVPEERPGVEELAVLLKEAIGFAKPGMPSDGEILVQGNVWPRGRFNK